MDKQIEKAPIIKTDTLVPFIIKDKQRDADHDYYTSGKGYQDIIADLKEKGWKDGSMTYCAYCGKEYPLDTDAKLIGEHINTCEKHPMYQLRKQFEGYKSPEEVEAIRVEAQHLAIEKLIRETETSAEQARQDAFKEVGEYLGTLIDNQDDDIDVHLMALVKSLKSGQHPGEKKE
jgi:hypothetical protein